MAIVTPTDRPKSVRNRCVIEVFCGVFVFSRCFLDFSVGIRAFVIGLSQISTFFTLYELDFNELRQNLRGIVHFLLLLHLFLYSCD